MLPLAVFAAVLCTIAVHGASGRRSAAPTLVVDNSFALDTTDPQRAFDPTSVIVDRALYDTLFTYRGNDLAHPVPLLVRSWSRSGARTYTFRLKANVHFADGTPLTAADVVFSLRRLVNLKGNPAFLVAGLRISEANEHTVVIRSATPDPQLLAVLANTSTGIVNSKLARAHGGSDAADASTADTAESWFNSPASAGAGSGPYELGSYAPTSQVVLRPNPDYWGAKKPSFGEIVIRNVTSPSQFLDIRRGGHQIALDLSSAQAVALEGERSLAVSVQPSPWVFYAFTNDGARVSPVTSNPQFQQAIRDALDYQAIAAIAGPGAIQAPGLIPSMIPGALPRTDAPKPDLEGAKTILARSGVAGREVTLDYPSDVTINGVSFATLAQKVQADLVAAGFKVALSGSPVATFQPTFRAGKLAFGLWLWAPDYPDPADYLVFTPGHLIARHVGWPAGSDPALERLARRALDTTAPATRASLYRQIQLALNANSPFIPLIQPAQAFVATSDLDGAVFSADYDVDVTQVSPS